MELECLVRKVSLKLLALLSPNKRVISCLSTVLTAVARSFLSETETGGEQGERRRHEGGWIGKVSRERERIQKRIAEKVRELKGQKERQEGEEEGTDEQI